MNWFGNFNNNQNINNEVAYKNKQNNEIFFQNEQIEDTNMFIDQNLQFKETPFQQIQMISNESKNENESEEEEEDDDESFVAEDDEKIKEENKKKKCSLTEHGEIDAISFCNECKIYMCNKCEKIHSGLLKHHFVYSLDKNITNIFTGTCKVKNHSMKLEYFCKNHNQLCCAACIAKIRCKGNGKHKNCKIFYINKIKKNKKNLLNENVIYLEDLSHTLEESINELKKLFETINENKEKLKLKIQKIFTKIRNTINDREDQILFQVDKEFDECFFKEDLIKESEKLPNKIKESLDRGKKIGNNEWDDEKKLSSIINDCLNIESDIKNINILKENIKKCNSNKDLEIYFSPEEDEINKFLDEIKNFGKIFHCKRNEEEKKKKKRKKDQK